jgi:diguanylate cyclase (GGDEF)-like protein
MAERSTILIVDDEIVSRYTVEILLESEGYNLVFAENGEEALKKAIELIPDLMLLDVMMPGMNGFEVCQQLRANPRLAELPVVMVTALDDRESRLQGIEAGADDFMSKPFDRAELRARVRTITRLNRYRRLVETEEQLAYLANYDVLTGLPNRTLLLERIQQAVGHAHGTQQGIVILFIDLDGFQMINDSLGHELGDNVLKEIAQRLTAELSKNTTIARLGGDEFVVMQEVTDPLKTGSYIAQCLLEKLSKPIYLDHHDIVITSSIGISVYPNDGEEAILLLKNANTAMSRTKSHGKNNYQFFTTEMNTAALERLILENQLRKVLINNELKVYYQPLIELCSGRIVGVEALLRWQHPTQGLLAPTKFIPIAEEMGLISQIGEWVLRTACYQTQVWSKLGFALQVSVNVSGKQFQQPNLFEIIENVLHETELSPTQLELELTESILMQEGKGSEDQCFAILSHLQDLGVHIAIDDFGTGYSSFSYLKRFPLNTLKIDRSFIKDICHNSDDAAITSAIIAMAHGLQLGVVAEGVENSAQVAFLHLRHCEIGQGFLFSRPQPAEQITQLLCRIRQQPFLFV